MPDIQARDRLLAAVEARVRRFTESGDPDGVSLVVSEID